MKNTFRKFEVFGVVVLCLLITTQSVLAFSDVDASVTGAEAIEGLEDEGVVNGYPDGSFRPYELVNRAEFLKMAMIASGQQFDTDDSFCFLDVRDEWYAVYICRAKNLGIVHGYPDGLFRPEQNVNFVEAAKMVVESFDYSVVPDDPWYAPYVEKIVDLDAYPSGIFSYDQKLTRAQSSEMIWGVMQPDENDDNDNGNADNEPLRQVFPSSLVAYHYYCPDCALNEKQKVSQCASLINFAGPLEFERLIEAYPTVKNILNIRYRLHQYIQFMNLDGNLNPTGQADLELLTDFANDEGHDLEDFFVHWAEPTEINHLEAKVIYDGNGGTTLVDTDGDMHEFETNRAIAIVWGDFYYVFDMNSPAVLEFMKWRSERELGEIIAGDVFDGYFQDVLNGPVSDTYQGIVSGGKVIEYDNKTPAQFSTSGKDSELIEDFQRELNLTVGDKVLLPNSGNYTQDQSLNVMLAGDGTITESVDFPNTTFWKEAWKNAETLADEGKYYSLGTSWSNQNVPENYPSGYYQDSAERVDIHTASFYWMAYELGYVLFDYGNACCDYISTWPEIMETDIGKPLSDVYLAAEGDLSNGWHWTLWARNYSGRSGSDGVTVYYRGNNAWRDGNDGALGAGTVGAVNFTLPSGSEILRADGTWVDAPDSIEHMESFGFVIKK